MTATIFEVSPSLTTPEDIKGDPGRRETADDEYQVSQTGPWTILPCSIAYCPLSAFLAPKKLAQLEEQANKIAANTKRLRDQICARQFRPNARLGQVEYLFDLGNWSPFFTGTKGKKYGTMLQMLQYPFSRGSVHIPPRNEREATTAHESPVIHPQFYLGPGEIDFEVMRLAQQFTDQICSTPPLADIIRSRVWPLTDDFEDFVKNCTVTDWHRKFMAISPMLHTRLTHTAVGTCAMGGSEGKNAGVVDERLRVYGVRGLRVVDASIMPLQVSAHIQATVYMIAEKAASIILEDA